MPSSRASGATRGAEHSASLDNRASVSPHRIWPIRARVWGGDRLTPPLEKEVPRAGRVLAPLSAHDEKNGSQCHYEL